MRILAAEAMRAMGRRDVLVRFPGFDSGLVTEDWLGKIAAEVFGDAGGMSFKLEPSDACPAGIAMVSRDGRRAFDNTYASRLVQMKDDLRIMLAD